MTLKKYSKKVITRFSLTFLLSLNNIMSARPELAQRPAMAEPRDMPPTIYNSVIITEAAQFGIIPTSVTKTGWKNPVDSINVWIEFSPTKYKSIPKIIFMTKTKINILSECKRG